ncbi:MAG: IclR family transcriptional regulator [Proteobacteria bacterium]|nr:IclR family transcriptional regulator [Pseudomonadota bacterium]MBU1452379.1 IclR family transcriptional regulator [Pseudomonadota bacterium]MBU2467895.1 IclR family transcriptional regulator [Pseudomonadota bacterium]MBU2517517.1 IclR family transcriptional regulator [Pseudomonadota bacterium]
MTLPNHLNQEASQNKSQRGVQSIHRAIGLLRIVVAHNERGISLAALARECDLHVATARRMLGALEAEGLLAHDPATKLYHLGIELFYFGAAAHQFQVRDRYRHTLERIARRTEDTVFLSIRSGNDSLVIDRVEGAFPIRTLTHEVGQRSPLGIGAGSTVLLATMPDKKVRAVIQANQRRYLNYKNSTPEQVWQSVNHYRQFGHSLTGGVFIPEAVAMARAVHDASGEVVAAISVAAIRQRMGPERREEIAAILQQEIEAIDKPNG